MKDRRAGFGNGDSRDGSKSDSKDAHAKKEGYEGYAPAISPNNMDSPSNQGIGEQVDYHDQVLFRDVCRCGDVDEELEHINLRRWQNKALYQSPQIDGNVRCCSCEEKRGHHEDDRSGSVSLLVCIGEEDEETNAVDNDVDPVTECFHPYRDQNGQCRRDNEGHFGLVTARNVLR